MKVILVVEDEPSIAEMLQTVLEDEGYAVVMAANGNEGLRRLAEMTEPPALVLSDVMMPDIDGPQMVRRMRENPAFAAIPVIMSSAAASKARFADIKYNAFLAKPYNIDTLLSIVHREIEP